MKKLIITLAIFAAAVGVFLYNNAGLNEQAYIDPSLLTPEAEFVPIGDNLTALIAPANVESAPETQSSPMTAALDKIVRVVQCVGQENTSLPAVLGEPNMTRQKSGGVVEWHWNNRFYTKMEEMPSTTSTVTATVTTDRRIGGIRMVLSTQLTRWLPLRDILLATGQGSGSGLEVYFDKNEVADFQNTKQRPYKGFLYLAVARYQGLVMSVHAYSDFPPVQVERKMDYQTSRQQLVVSPLYNVSELRYLDMKVEEVMVAPGSTKVSIPKRLASIFNPPSSL